jgi:perosamine synthetase
MSAIQSKPRLVPLSLPSIGDEEKQAVLDVLDTGWLTHGPKNLEFEEAFAVYHGVAHAVSMNSCASALQCAVEGLGITGEVIVPSFTWVASANAIVKGGAEPVFADIDETTCNVSVASVERLVTSRTEAIMPVHYAGQVADMTGIMRVAEKHGLAVIEDSAETLGGLHQGKLAGTWGIGCYSFFPTKSITTGEGGMLLTHDGSLARRVRSLIGHGIDRSTYQREVADKPWFRGASNVGYNFRMSNFQAAMGLGQLSKLDEMNEKRRGLARSYNAQLSHLPDISLATELPGNRHVFQMYTIKVRDASLRDDLVNDLRAAGVGASVHFAPPVHEMIPYRAGYRLDDLSVTVDVAARIVTLPMYPDMHTDDVTYVCEAIHLFFGSSM